jgi:hypothetical protein
MDRFNKLIDYLSGHFFEPSLNWAIDHPIISTVAVVALIYISVRNYRML